MAKGAFSPAKVLIVDKFGGVDKSMMEGGKEGWGGANDSNKQLRSASEGR